MYRTLLLVFGSHRGGCNGLFSTPKWPDRDSSPPGVQFSGYQGSVTTQKTQKISASANTVYFNQLPIIKSRLTQIKDKLGTFIPYHDTRFISARLFSVVQVANEVKRTPHCGCCWDPRSRNWWIEEGPNRAIIGSFSENVRPCKSCIYADGFYFEFKKMYVSSSHQFDFLKINHS